MGRIIERLDYKNRQGRVRKMSAENGNIGNSMAGDNVNAGKFAQGTDSNIIENTNNNHRGGGSLPQIDHD